MFKFFGADQAQHQFLNVNAVSEALHFASPATKRALDRGCVSDLDRSFHFNGQCLRPNRRGARVRWDPLPLFNPQFTYLADSQDNFAWAVFGNVDVDLTDKLELSTALRYDRDDRENTTETPAEFIPAPLVGIAFPGQVRTHTWDDWQPKVTLRHKPTPDSTLYAGYSRGPQRRLQSNRCRCSGNCRCERLVDAETANTYEAGVKAEFLDRRRRQPQAWSHAGERLLLLRVRSEHEHVNLGNLDRVDRTGAEFEVRGRILEGFDGYVGVGFTDSDIKESRRAASDVGNEAPLVSRDRQRGLRNAIPCAAS